MQNVSQVGIIEIKLDTPFHNIMKKICGINIDVVGLYYKLNNSTPINAMLYDTYTGKLLTKKVVKLDDLKCDKNVEILTIYPLLFEPGSEVEKNFMLAVTNAATENVVPKSKRNEEVQIRYRIRAMILTMAGLENIDSISENGYSIVNKILLSVSEIEHTKIVGKFASSFVKLPFVGTALTFPIENTKVIIEDFNMELSFLFDVTKDLYCNNEMFQRMFLANIKNGDIKNFEDSNDVPFIITNSLKLISDKNEKTIKEELIDARDRINKLEKDLKTIFKIEDRLFSSLSKMDNTSINSVISEVNSIRKTYHTNIIKNIKPFDDYTQNQERIINIKAHFDNLINDIKNGIIPTLNLNKYINDMEPILINYGIERIELSKYLPNMSCYCILVVDGSEIDNNMENIVLKSGNTITLPSSYANLKYIETDIILEIVKYLDSINTEDIRFKTLQMDCSRELAIRNSTKT